MTACVFAVVTEAAMSAFEDPICNPTCGLASGSLDILDHNTSSKSVAAGRSSYALAPCADILDRIAHIYRCLRCARGSDLRSSSIAETSCHGISYIVSKICIPS
jgi:hypothetical protein